MEQLNNGANTVSQKLWMGGTVVAKRLGPTLATVPAGDKSRALVNVEEMGMQVWVPANIFKSYVRSPDSDVGIIVASDDANANETNVSWVTAWIMLVGLPSGNEYKVNELPEPESVIFSMPERFRYRLGGQCQYYENSTESFSQKGVWVGKDTKEAGLCWCETTHFTLFRALLAGIRDAVLCARFSLFSGEAMEQITIGDWYANSGTLLFWLSLVGLVSAIAGTTFLDHMRKPRGWAMEELFLVPVGSPPPLLGGIISDSDDGAPPDDDGRGSTASLRHSSGSFGGSTGSLLPVRSPVRWGLITKWVSKCGQIWKRLLGPALHEALKEVVDAYFLRAEAARNSFEDLFHTADTSASGASGGSGGSRFNRDRDRVPPARIRAMTFLAVHAAENSAAADMNLSLNSVTFVLKDKLLAGLLSERHRRRRRHGLNLLAEQTAWYRCTTTEEAWARLHTNCSNRIQLFLHQQAFRPYHIFNFFRLYSPLGGMLASDIFTNRKMRALFHMMELGGALLVVSLFFIASGQLKSKWGLGGSVGGETTVVKCGDQVFSSGLWYYMGRNFIISLFSVLLATIPVAFVKSLRTRQLKEFDHQGSADWKQQLKAWLVQDVLACFFGALYLAVCIFFLVLFLANLSDQDQAEWAATAFLSLLMKEVLVPLFLAIFIPLLADLLVFFNAWATRKTRAQMLHEAQRELFSKTNVMLPLTAI